MLILFPSGFIKMDESISIAPENYFQMAHTVVNQILCNYRHYCGWPIPARKASQFRPNVFVPTRGSFLLLQARRKWQEVETGNGKTMVQKVDPHVQRKRNKTMQVEGRSFFFNFNLDSLHFFSRYLCHGAQECAWDRQEICVVLLL